MNHRYLFDYFAQKYNLTLNKGELEEIVKVVVESGKEIPCTGCLESRKIKECITVPNTARCNLIRFNSGVEK